MSRARRVVDVADEAQREVIVLRIDPARTRQPAAHHGKRLGDLRRNFETGEQTWHDTCASWPAIRSKAQHEGIAHAAQACGGCQLRIWAMSSCTLGKMCATIAFTPAALGCSPSACRRVRSAAVPARKKGYSSTPYLAASSG